MKRMIIALLLLALSSCAAQKQKDAAEINSEMQEMQQRQNLEAEAECPKRKEAAALAEKFSKYPITTYALAFLDGEILAYNGGGKIAFKVTSKFKNNILVLYMVDSEPWGIDGNDAVMVIDIRLKKACLKCKPKPFFTARTDKAKKEGCLDVVNWDYSTLLENAMGPEAEKVELAFDATEDFFHILKAAPRVQVITNDPAILEVLDKK